MNKNLIKKNYKKKLDLFDRFNKKYFDQNISEISDADFDELNSNLASLKASESQLKEDIQFLNERSKF